MVMINNTFPYTHRPLTEFFPKGLFYRNVIQKIYPHAILDPGMLAFAKYWMFNANQPYLCSD